MSDPVVVVAQLSSFVLPTQASALIRVPASLSTFIILIRKEIMHTISSRISIRHTLCKTKSIIIVSGLQKKLMSLEGFCKENSA